MADPGHIPGATYIPGVVAIRLVWTLPNGKQANNVLHGHYTTPPTFSQSSVNALFTSVSTAFTASGLAGDLDTQTTLAALGMRDMAQGSDGFGYGEWLSNLEGVDGAGPGPGGPLPAQISFVVSLKTGRSGQANRGRVYIPGWHSSADDGAGHCQNDSALHAVDFIVRIQAAMTSAGFPLAIAHPARAAYDGTGDPPVSHPARAAGYVLVTGITKLNNVWDTQRLRNKV